MADEMIADPLVDHACSHTVGGPYAFVEASGLASMAPELRNTHTAYTLALPVQASGAHSGFVRLRPRGTGVFAIFLSENVTTFVETIDTAVPVCLLQMRNGNGCAKIASSRSFRAERLQDLTIKIGPSQSTSVMMVLEQLTDTNEGG